MLLLCVCVNINVSDVVWRSQPLARSSISRQARKRDTYIASKMAELSKTFERRDTSELTCTIIALVRLVAAATIRERHLFCSALAQVRLLFESGVYSVIHGKHFRHFIEGCSFCIFTDHKPLTHALSSLSDRYTPRQICHMDLISHFSTISGMSAVATTQWLMYSRALFVGQRTIPYS